MTKMISLQNFIISSNIRPIYENKMGKKDWYHRGDYVYAKDLINRLLNGEEIATDKDSKINVDIFDKNKLKELLNKIETGETTTSSDLQDTLKEPQKNLIWNSINKSLFRGVDNIKINTADQENITCELFKSILNGENIDLKNMKYIESVREKITSTDPGVLWYSSWKYQCEQLKDTDNIDALNNLKKKTNIEVCRTPDLKKHKLKIVLDLVNYLAEHNKVSAAAIDSSDIYCFDDVDYINDKLNDIKESDSKCEEIMNIFTELFNEGHLVGISLKKVTKQGNKITLPKLDKDVMPTLTLLSYRKRDSKSSNHVSLTWDAVLERNNDEEKVIFNLRDNGQGTTRFELLSKSNQRIGDVPHNVWANKDVDSSLVNLLGINVENKKVSPEDVYEKCNDIEEWNTDEFKSAFLYYYNLAAKISDISIPHLLCM